MSNEAGEQGPIHPAQRDYAQLVFLDGDNPIAAKSILRATTLIGSAPGCNVQLAVDEVDAAHCVITLDSGVFSVHDLRSRIGVALNGNKVSFARLKDGDRLQIGPFSCRIETNLVDQRERQTREFLLQQEQLRAEWEKLETNRRQLEADAASITALQQSVTQQRQQASLEQQQLHQARLALEERFEKLDHERQLEIDRLNLERQDVARKTAAVEALKAELSRAQGQLDGERSILAQEREQLREATFLLDRERQETSAERQRATFTSSELEAGRQRATELAEQLQARHEELTTQLIALDEDRARLDAGRTDLEKQQAALDEQRRQMEEREAEIYDLQTSLRHQQETLDAEAESLAQLRRRVLHGSAEVEHGLADLREQRDQFRAERAEQETRQQQLDKDAEQLRVDRDKLEQDQAIVAKEKAELHGEQEQSAKLIKSIEQRRQQIAKGEAGLIAERREFELERRKHAELATQLERRLKEADERSASLELEWQRLERQQEQTAKTAADLERGLEAVREQQRQLRAEEAQLRRDREELAYHRRELDTQEQWLRTNRTEWESEKRQLAQREQKLTKLESVSDPGVAMRLLKAELITRFQAEWFLRGRIRDATVGGFRLIDVLDAGGMSWLYVADDLRTGQRFVLKTLALQHAGNPDIVTRFELEAKAAGKLNHPNVLRVYRLEQSDDLLFLVTEFVFGMNLDELVRLRGRLRWPQACHLIAQAADGLAHLHDAGMVHRDIKPANLLLGEQGVKIVDLGFVMLGQDDDEFALARIFGHEHIGTADYIAPEQAVDSFGVDARADIYSLGASLYFALTGEAMFAADSNLKKIEAHRNRPIPPLRAKAPDVPTDVVKIIERMLAKNPDGRFDSSREVADALAPFAQRDRMTIDPFEYHLVLKTRADYCRQRLRALAARLDGDSALSVINRTAPDSPDK